jgi:hypothetical protein
MRHLICIAALACAVSGCYAGSSKVSPDINEAWRGQSVAEIEASWGPPAAVEEVHEGTLLTWSHTRRWQSTRIDADLEGPVRVGIEGAARLEPGEASAEGAISLDGPRVRVEQGPVRERTRMVEALVEPGGTIAEVTGPSIFWGRPQNANLRWGMLLGLHAGMGRLDSTSTPLPSGGVHIGGLLGPRHGLVGTFSMVSGKGEGGGAMGLSWGLAATWWPHTRTSVRAGPAMVLDWKPGFEDRAFGLGATGGASFALVRAGSFVMDLRLDATAHPHSQFGSLGIGVNLN